MKVEKPLQLTLTVDEINQILDALGDRPFKEIFGLIQKIQNQAASQLDNSNDSE